MTPQSVPLPFDDEEDDDEEGDGAAEAGVEGDAEEETTIVAKVVGAGDDGAGRATSAFTSTALGSSSFSVTVLDGLGAGVDGGDGGSGAADELGGEDGDGDGAGLPLEGPEPPPPHKSA